MRRVTELESVTSARTRAGADVDVERPANGLSLQDVIAEVSDASGAPFKPMVLEGEPPPEPTEGDLVLQNLREELQDIS